MAPRDVCRHREHPCKKGGSFRNHLDLKPRGNASLSQNTGTHYRFRLKNTLFSNILLGTVKIPATGRVAEGTARAGRLSLANIPSSTNLTYDLEDLVAGQIANREDGFPLGPP